MRISDWSSDVCSSDLPLPAPLDDMFGILAVIELPSEYKETALFANGSWRVTDRFKIDAGVRQARTDQWFSQNVPEGVLVAIGESPGESDEEIGRASCRESVSVRVDLGGRGILKKKNQ